MATYYIEFTERALELQLTSISNTRKVSGEVLEVEAEEVDVAPLRSSLKINILHSYFRHLIFNSRAKGEPLKVGPIFFNDLLGKPRVANGSR